MPGLFGFQLKRKDTEIHSEFLIQSMADSLNHFETYSCSTYTNGDLGFGTIGINRRGCQRFYEDKTSGIAIGLFGEIFKYEINGRGIEPEPSDKVLNEVSLLYKSHGLDTPEMINGDYNIALHDRSKDLLMVFNDRFGYRQLYVYEDDSIVMFSPEIKAFLCYPGFDKSLDEQGLSDYFVFFYPLGDRTLFEKVKLHPPATKLLLKKGSLSKQRYWHPKYSCEIKKPHFNEGVEQAYHLFKESMKRCLKGRQSLVIPLSGGLDSRLLLSTARQLGCEVKAATFGEEGSREYRIACKVCRVLGMEKPQLIRIRSDWVSRFGKLMTWIAEGNYATLATTRLYGFYKEMGPDFDGLLNGIFGCKLSFGPGYYSAKELPLNRDTEANINRVTSGLNGHRYDRILSSIASDELNAIVGTYKKRSIAEEWERTSEASDIDVLRKDNLYLYNRIRRGMNNIDLNRYFYEDLLPFSSYELYEFYLSLSPEISINYQIYKEIYKRKLPGLARIPWQQTGVNLYKEPSTLRKRWDWGRDCLLYYSTRLSRGRVNIRDQNAYMHYDSDFRQTKALRNWFADILLSERFLNRGLFHREGLEELMRFEREGGRVFHELGKLAVFELWARRFLD